MDANGRSAGTVYTLFRGGETLCQFALISLAMRYAERGGREEKPKRSVGPRGHKNRARTGHRSTQEIDGDS